MDSTNNEIYKIAKYLDKYTKYGNKEGGVYLQKLDNYLHKVQYGGNREIVKLAEEIGRIVTEVVDKHQKAKGELGEMVEGVVGEDLTDKIVALQEKKEGLEKTIAQKEAELAREASSSAPVPVSAPASAAPEPVTFETLTDEQLKKLNQVSLYELVCQMAKIDPNNNDLKVAFTKRVGVPNFQDDWNFKDLLNELCIEQYFKEDKNIINLMKMILALLQLHSKFSTGSAPSEIEKIEEIYNIIEHLDKNGDDIQLFNRYIKEEILKKEDYTFTFDDFEQFKEQLKTASQAPPAPSVASSPTQAFIRERVPPSSEVLAQQVLAEKLSKEAQVKHSELKPVPQKDPKNPTSKKFDIVGFTINKQGQRSTYVIPEQQKTTVLEVLPRELKDQLENENVQLLENKKARIEFKNFLLIKEILRQINERESLLPTKFLTTGKTQGNTLLVWLFIVPMTYNLDKNTQNKEYFDAINKIEEEELKKIAFIMDGIIKGRQPVAQSLRTEGV
jgi:hypothetical protein